jgi:adenylate cyclase
MRLIGKAPWERNPRMCRFCARWLLKRGAGGAEVTLALVFADVRGSTGLAERMAPRAYSALINRFFTAATDAIVRCDGVVDQLVGDEAIGLFLPGDAGPRYTRRALDASRMLLAATGHGGGAPWLPVGVGVHTGVAYVGSVGSGETFTDFTALGDAVNTTARLASEAGAGEILITAAAAHHAALMPQDSQRRTLSVKGRTEPLSVYALRDDVRPE